MRFTIRDLLWLMVVMGMAVMLLMMRYRESREISDLQRERDELQGALADAARKWAAEKGEPVRLSAGLSSRNLTIEATPSGRTAFIEFPN